MVSPCLQGDGDIPNTIRIGVAHSCTITAPTIKNSIELRCGKACDFVHVHLECDGVVRQYIAKSVKVVVYVHRGIEEMDGIAKVVRKVTEICLVKGAANGRYELENVA